VDVESVRANAPAAVAASVRVRAATMPPVASTRANATPARTVAAKRASAIGRDAMWVANAHTVMPPRSKKMNTKQGKSASFSKKDKELVLDAGNANGGGGEWKEGRKKIVLKNGGWRWLRGG
jgi:hypothetical protein